MRLPLLFRRENSSAARREREEQLEKALTQGMRKLADLLKQAADQLEARRLEKRGYEPQERFLERADKDRR
ncbi:MAG: hypothetical protein AMXMBFR34_34090 [Myxococcaceae bacterium]